MVAAQREVEHRRSIAAARRRGAAFFNRVTSGKGTILLDAVKLLKASLTALPFNGANLQLEFDALY